MNSFAPSQHKLRDFPKHSNNRFFFLRFHRGLIQWRTHHFRNLLTDFFFFFVFWSIKMFVLMTYNPFGSLEMLQHSAKNF